jgi:hypothetical protein
MVFYSSGVCQLVLYSSLQVLLAAILGCKVKHSTQKEKNKRHMAFAMHIMFRSAACKQLHLVLTASLHTAHEHFTSNMQHQLAAGARRALLLQEKTGDLFQAVAPAAPHKQTAQSYSKAATRNPETWHGMAWQEHLLPTALCKPQQSASENCTASKHCTG